MESSSPLKTSGITMRDKLGYAFGDMAGCLFLGMIGPFLQMFYTDVLHISALRITVLLFVARIWGAFYDPVWGTVVDRRPVGRHGKFRPYLRSLSIPLAVCGILTFTYIPGLSANQYLLFAYVTYIAYVMLYTGTNIPFGSMASVMTDDGAERSQLSIFRTLGAGVGGLPAALLLPQLVYSTLDGKETLDPKKLFISALVLGICCVAVYMASFHMTTERVPPPAKEEKHDIRATVAALMRNRPFMTLCLASTLLIGISFYTQTIYNFLYKDYFMDPKLYTFVTMATYAPMALLVPVLPKLVGRLGKKRLCAWGLLLSAATNIAALLLRTSSPHVFLAFCFLSGLGGTFLTMMNWAMVTDVIDYQELLTNRREEGTTYAFFSFTRKLGQTLAGSGSSYLLGAIGYDDRRPGYARRMYTAATAVPAIAYTLMFLTVALLYPLGRRREAEMREQLRRQRGEANAT